MAQDTDHLRTIAKLYRRTWGEQVVNAGYIDWAADEIERLRAEREHWLQFVSTADRVQFPFNPQQ